MVEWKHKDDNWQSARRESSYDDPNTTVTYWGWKVEGGVPRFIAMSEKAYTKGTLSFTDWLDLHCSGGWEVLKISRDFNGGLTWVVFRKQI